MKHYVIANNFQLSAIFRMSGGNKIISKERIESNHTTKLIYENLTPNEISYLNIYFAGKLKEVKE